MKINLYVSVLMLGLAGISKAFGQCDTPLPTTTCCTGMTQLTTSTQVIGAGDNYYVPAGTTMTVSSIYNIWGGTLHVYGDLTLPNPNGFSGADIIVEPGGKLTLTSYNFGVNNPARLTNYGTLVFPNGVNSNSKLINASSGVINVTDFYSNGTGFTNYGTMNVSNKLEISSPICTQGNSYIYTDYLVNNGNNGITVQGGSSYLKVNKQFTSYQPLTNTSSLIVCLSPGAVETPYNHYYGEASVSINCMGFPNQPMPVSYLYFDGQRNNNVVQLNWATSNEKNSWKFVVERAKEDLKFAPIHEGLAAAGTSDQIKKYVFTDASPLEGMNYYRLRQYDTDGKSEYSRAVAVLFKAGTVSYRVYPNPTTEYVTVKMNGPVVPSSIELHSVSGQRISQSSINTAESTVSLKDVTAGIYFLIIRSEDQVERIRIIKN